MYYLDLSSNLFTNDIPSSLGNFQGLLSLNLSKNSFTGHIPETFSNLIVLQYLDLSSNTLSGYREKFFAEEYLQISITSHLWGILNFVEMPNSEFLYVEVKPNQTKE
ncbi:receptor-like protein 20 [Actinidia eriantha]|uniref:receptor-like protein 20 n=1 Tax=Actinidia eriantha TaxID=165200 RepID=UPI0025844890|nr:receptor-like protein 20 [Actinidia eriantha]